MACFDQVTRYPLPQFHSCWNPFGEYANFIMAERPRDILKLMDFGDRVLFGVGSFAEIQKPMGRRATEHSLTLALFRIAICTYMFKHVQATAGHHALAGGPVVVVHICEGFPKQV